MTRRMFGASLVAAAIAAAVPAPSARDGWIVVAHGGENAAGRIYSDNALHQMCDGMKGLHVHWFNKLGVETPLTLTGVVSECRLRDGAVEVKIGWFGNPQTDGLQVAPNGEAVGWQNSGLDGTDLPMTITDYRPKSLSLGSYSTFERATRL